jgi:hypothetical protein
VLSAGARVAADFARHLHEAVADGHQELIPRAVAHARRNVLLLWAFEEQRCVANEWSGDKSEQR